MTEPDVAALRAAYRDAAVTDLDRSHDEIVADAAARVGVDVETADAALPRLASKAWQREFSVSRDAPPIPDDLTLAAALEILRSDAEPAVRAQAVSDALAYAPDGDTVEIALAALDDSAAVVRRTAVRRSWLASGKLAALRTRIGELVSSDADESVRAAAIRATAIAGDDSPATVTALLATISPANASSLRIAAAKALAANARGYARVCRSLLRWAAVEDDVPVRDALYEAGARLATEAEWPHLVDALMVKGALDPRVGLHLMVAMRDVPDTRIAIRDAAVVMLASDDPAKRRGAVHLLAGTTAVGDEADIDAQRAVEALADDPDESVRDAVYVTSGGRHRLRETGG